MIKSGSVPVFSSPADGDAGDGAACAVHGCRRQDDLPRRLATLPKRWPRRSAGSSSPGVRARVQERLAPYQAEVDAAERALQEARGR